MDSEKVFGRLDEEFQAQVSLVARYLPDYADRIEELKSVELYELDAYLNAATEVQRLASQATDASRVFVPIASTAPGCRTPAGWRSTVPIRPCPEGPQLPPRVVKPLLLTVPNSGYRELTSVHDVYLQAHSEGLTARC